MTPGRRLLVLQFAATLGTALTTARQLTPAHLGAEWPYYAADAAATHYSALERITRGGRVSPQAALGVASRRGGVVGVRTRPGSFQNTPLMIDGVLYVSTPYNQVAALDATTGEQRSRGPRGWPARERPGVHPELRVHPALVGVSLPDRLGAPGPAGAIVTKGGLIFIGSGDTALYAFDKDTGRELLRLPTGEAVQATPMTNLDRNGRQIVAVATGRADQTALLAFGLQ